MCVCVVWICKWLYVDVEWLYTIAFLIIGEGRAVWSMWWIDDEIFMKSVKQGPGAWFSHSCLWFGAVCLSGPRWRTEPRGDGSGHRGSSLWVMIFQPGVFKALLILLSITGPPFRPPAPPCTEAPQSIWRGCCCEMCFTGKWQDAYAANKSSPSPDGFFLSLSLSFPWERAEEIYKSGDCPRGMGTLHVEMFPTIRCILGSSAWHHLQVHL